jgi:hypothetical protein
VVRVELEVLVHSNDYVECLALIFEVIGNHIILRYKRAYVYSYLLPYFSDGTGYTILSLVHFTLRKPIVFVGEIGD